jgi:hypothetical protein
VRDDVGVAPEDSVREPVVAEETARRFRPGLSSGERGGSGRIVMLLGTASLPERCQPARSSRSTALGAGRDRSADLAEVGLHRLGVAPGHDEAGALALGGTDGAEDVGPFRALVVGCPRPGAALRPAAGDLVFSVRPSPRRRTRPLPACREPRPARSPPGGRGSPFFERLQHLVVLRMVPRPRAHLPEAQCAQLPSHRRLADRHAEGLPEPLHEADQPPAHDAVNAASRSSHNLQPGSGRSVAPAWAWKIR